MNQLRFLQTLEDPDEVSDEIMDNVNDGQDDPNDILD